MSAHLKAVRLRLAIIAIALLSACAGFAAAAAPSDAAWGFFCPPAAGGTTVTIGGSSRCVHGTPHGDMRQVLAVTYNGAGVSHCAALKEQSDGFGGNNGVTPMCGTGAAQSTSCFSARYGFATIINQSTSAHRFYGEFAYAGGCIPG